MQLLLCSMQVRVRVHIIVCICIVLLNITGTDFDSATSSFINWNILQWFAQFEVNFKDTMGHSKVKHSSYFLDIFMYELAKFGGFYV